MTDVRHLAYLVRTRQLALAAVPDDQRKDVDVLARTMSDAALVQCADAARFARGSSGFGNATHSRVH